ncbi:59bc16f8-917b-4682-a447-193ab9228023 [Sclerotinia trifoliorum]|uniref:59bc16f8-917b-4682-a447-193ab9228023 n=1 Tax=Sclerotinia trifoliorum TaxID=28548 RepID=A0A8H2VKQ3_9HELO|nr:59bc16f8-917b-4682-a447-193ab9228023 [Sclerotinia trifoliorum]
MIDTICSYPPPALVGSSHYRYVEYRPGGTPGPNINTNTDSYEAQIAKNYQDGEASNMSRNHTARASGERYSDSYPAVYSQGVSTTSNSYVEEQMAEFYTGRGREQVERSGMQGRGRSKSRRELEETGYAYRYLSDGELIRRVKEDHLKSYGK